MADPGGRRATGDSDGREAGGETPVLMPMDEAAARAIYTWRYDAPYDIYNLADAPLEEVLAVLLDPANAYYRILGKDGELLAFCCFGPDAQVPGGDYTLPALDIGLGLRPDLTGRGQGLGYVQAAVERTRQWAPPALRVTIAAFNERARRTWQKAGFEVQQTFGRAKDGAPFVVLVGRP